jgi:uncharacterized membrane protein YraQ (UPF0718 family)
MEPFLSRWSEAAWTSLGFFWMAFWAFCLGYWISSMIQVFVTEQRMQRAMGEAGVQSVALGTFFGFISSSCSFAALSTSRALFQKGAGLVAALAFLLASTNLVIELGILIFVFLEWQFVVGEYVGGLILIGVMWLVVRLTLPARLEADAREHAEAVAGTADDGEVPDWRALARSREGWRQVARRFFMEWGMVWKDVTFGFTVAGAIAAFVPPAFFRTLFPGGTDPSGWEIAAQTLIGPLAAFFTFIGSMGNIPLAAVLFTSGVSFAGVMAFIFSDLVVFPVLRISAQYFGWKMAVYILAVFLVCLVTASLLLHGAFSLADALPAAGAVDASRTAPSERFAVDYTFFLNLGFGALAVGLWALARTGDDDAHDHGDGERSWTDVLLTVLAVASLAWLAGGVAVGLLRQGPGG